MRNVSCTNAHDHKLCHFGRDWVDMVRSKCIYSSFIKLATWERLKALYQHGNSGEEAIGLAPVLYPKSEIGL
jgi:hypothetical protein